MATAMDVARYFLAQPEEGNDMTNVKLQKMCAYAQALSLAALKRPLFGEDMEAWRHGPVIPAVYAQYSRYGRGLIPPNGLSGEAARAPFDDEQKFIVEFVRSYYGDFSARKLIDMSHGDFDGDWGGKRTMPKAGIARSFRDNPMVAELNRSDPLPNPTRLADAAEVERALGL